MFADYQAINQTPGVTPGSRLGEPGTATTVRVEGGETLTTDGPFVAVKEAIGGWLVLRGRRLDAAIELAARASRPRGLGGADRGAPDRRRLRGLSGGRPRAHLP